MSQPSVAILHRGRFRDLPDVECRATAPNVFTVAVPRGAVRQLLRREPTAEAFDDAVWLIGEVESVQSVGSADHPDRIEVTVVLP